MGIKDKLKEKAEQETKRKMKKVLRLKLIQIIAGLLIPIMIAICFYTIMMSVQRKLINVGNTLSNFRKWITDDYWIKLDEKVEFSYLDEETRKRNKYTRYFS